jgi:hypothetical protein
MTIIGLVVILVILGVIGWLVNTKAPISAGFKLLINIVLIVIASLIVLKAFGLLGDLDMQVPKLH